MACPTCGGKVNADGEALVDPKDLVFPDEAGEWIEDGEVVHRSDGDMPDNQRKNIASAITQELPAVRRETDRLEKEKSRPYVKGLARRRKPRKNKKRGAVQALLRMRRDAARDK